MTEQAAQAAAPANDGEKKAGVTMFSFGEPEAVLASSVFDMLNSWDNGRWYEPPISLDGLARTFRASPHHSSAIILKRNLLASSLSPDSLISRRDFTALVQDYLVLGNAYPQVIRNRLGGLLKLGYMPAKFVRRSKKAGEYWWVPGLGQEKPIATGQVLHLLSPDINQEIYGLPEYLSALQAALLNENATLFRRRYFENGSHAGYIFYATGEFAEGDVDAMRDNLKASKGPGNFRNMFMHAPDGKENGIKIIPIAEVAAKDDFMGIKNTSRDDVLAAHRVPPQLLGVIPQNTGGFGDVAKALDAFFELEMEPLQAVFLELNDQLGQTAIKFKQRTIAATE